ncbi:methionine synthase [Mycolicibacterium brumae]|uniref:Methionine synthase n=1 Tax=Mycolicibacterium brumae TaxID=85968 RepID=A0A2G5P8C6_9MYCO|nr:methionine synthase [Mycolicibacterium brumae]MCV7194842.1 methionine synthase [Mycolicibacterium brumae]PIB74507.1 methionine synthase [Mycolicibacterium brumae]RWA19737.1 hypothetical protein MBRU_16235 [Mycolicibacterium brumae DSM 44177]UWW09517.1 methionine synthase [Mycolicibacterium brumae]
MRPFATATGIGSWPGTSAREAAEIVVGELTSLTPLPELPARGVGADLVGRAGALLIDIAVDTCPRGYRVVGRRGSVTRRARSLLAEDLDALEEAWEKAGLRGSGRPVKVAAPGPITLAAQLELSGGHRAITDAGAVRDLTASLAEGLAAHRAEVARRLDTDVVVQLDEPSLPAALAGRLSGVTALSAVHPIDAPLAVTLLDEVAAVVSVPVSAHCCAADVPWELLRRSQIHAVAVDAGLLSAGGLDGLGEFLETGRTVALGVVPSTAVTPVPAAEQVAAAAAAVTDRLGFPRAVLAAQIGLTPACGLAGASLDWARVAIGLCQAAADGIAVDPDSA